MFRLFVLLLAVVCGASLSLLSAELYTPLTPEEMAAFNQQILNEVQKQDALATDALQKMRDSASMSPAEMARLQVLVSMSQVKRTLANQLLNTPSMQSPAVRQAFLQVMQLPIIEERNLAQLQLLIDSEKAKMAAAKAPSQEAAPQEPVVQEPVVQEPVIEESPNVEVQSAQ